MGFGSYTIIFARAVTKSKLLVQIRRFFLTLDRLLFYAKLILIFAQKISFNSVNVRLKTLDTIFSCRNLNKLSVKCILFEILKTRIINGPEKCFCHCPIAMTKEAQPVT